MKNTTSDNNRTGFKYLQPVPMEAIDYLLRDCDVGEYSHFNDEWDRTEYESRTDVIESLVESIHWITDGNREMIHTRLEDSTIFNEWSGGRDQVEQFIKKYDDVNEGRHYSVYPNTADENSADDDSITGTEQNVERKKTRSEWEKRTIQGNKMLNNTR